MATSTRPALSPKSATSVERPSSVIVHVQTPLLTLPSAEKEVVFYLVVTDGADGSDGDLVRVQNLRLEGGQHPPLLLSDVPGAAEVLARMRTEMLSSTEQYLTAVTQLRDGNIEKVANEHKVDPVLLKSWADYAMVGGTGNVRVEGHYTNKLESNGSDFVRGWGTHETPSIFANSSDRDVRIPGHSKAHSVVVHPSPTLYTAAGWRSPIEGRISIEAKIADAHPECGNGVEWLVQVRSGTQTWTLALGDFERAASDAVPPTQVSIRKGDLVSLLVGPRASQHACDLTHVEFTINEIGGESRRWDLADDISDDIQSANPHADSLGNPDTWHFYRGEMASIDRSRMMHDRVPPGSVLDRWIAEEDPTLKNLLAKKVQQLVTGPRPDDEADGLLYDNLHSLPIPLDHSRLKNNIASDPRFGKHPNGDSIGASDLVVKAPAVVEFRVPADLAEGRDVAAEVTADSAAGKTASVQVRLSTNRPDPQSDQSAAVPSLPFLVSEEGTTERRVAQNLKEFRDLFPPALCYWRIVPVDEVVTMLLFYREDVHLQRLMLDDDEVAELDRLWDELFYIAREPLKLVIAHEQSYEFSTQDRPDLVKEFAPLREPIRKRAKAFRRRMLDLQPNHLDSIFDFAAKAWRRPLSEAEREKLNQLYRELRETEIAHEQTIRLLLARILASPDFLYRREQPRDGRQGPVTSWELATRLSYFLWSSLPDDELRDAAADSTVLRESVLLDQTRRMLRDPRARRLAEQFACQWLHVRQFDRREEKNEKLYPQFANLRSAMYEETLRFFEDFIRNDRSVLSILNADHVFLNTALAQHYGIDSVEGDRWRRVDGARQWGRGGILTMATVLSSQSGASRTSPILRGNWVYETLLGQRLPRPPADVPPLPDERPEGLTARELIERHGSDPACAKCHQKIDPFGFALEQYDAIGRRRPEAVDTTTRLDDGHRIDGVDGLRHYLLSHRRDDFVRQFCRKLLGFALGREVQLSDQPLLESMQQRLEGNDYRFSSAVETIVTSRQFQDIRGRDYVEN